ncbi:MAG: ion transporter [Candidatus Hinthialibacter antarcticus]|nr:ion transporter [Candidatus Hinthialibacter antarcticus]
MTENRSWRHRLHEIIFEADTKIGKAFDVVLIACILASVIAVMLESVKEIREVYGPYLYAAEWVFTILFTVEYVLRLACIGRPLRYAFSFYGIVDLIAILPTYLDQFLPGARFMLVVRVLRVLRIFRVLKLAQYIREADLLIKALRASRRKIAVFIYTVAIVVVIIGSFMHLIEGEENGFTSIPRSVYWAVVTLTTVGYGDISPQTPFGQTVAMFIMVLGYGMIAVPTGIVTAELISVNPKKISTQACLECGAEGHDFDAVHCKYCGAKL